MNKRSVENSNRTPSLPGRCGRWIAHGFTEIFTYWSSYETIHEVALGVGWNDRGITGSGFTVSQKSDGTEQCPDGVVSRVGRPSRQL